MTVMAPQTKKDSFLNLPAFNAKTRKEDGMVQILLSPAVYGGAYDLGYGQYG